MYNGDSNTVSCSMGFAGILTIVFVIAKIIGFVDWSWFLVFLPVIIYAAFLLGLIAVGFIVFVVASVVKEEKKRNG